MRLGGGLVVLLIGAFALTACAGTATAPASPSSAAGRAPSSLPNRAGDAHSLADAEALVYANRYGDADAAYRRLASAQPQNPYVHASFALFLNDRLDFSAARAEAARAVAGGPGVGRAHAVLCRVDDWSGHIDDAVAEGRRAVALDGGDVLAHLFLSEALADHGDIPGGRAEIAAAAALLTDSSSDYLRAEVHREEGNLARDNGDVQAELTGFLAAYHAQPGWVERPEELASAYMDGGDLAGAHNAAARALELAPGDAGLLEQLGRITMLQPDYATADVAFTQLVALRPGDSTALELAAHALFADRADLDGAVALLERSITARPSNEEAVAYLLYLERDVRDDEARGRQEVADAVAASVDGLGPSHRRSPTVPDVAAVQAVHAQRALADLNRARAAAGLGPVVLDDHLSTAALTHCFYWLFNNGSPTVAKLGIHQETPGLPGFSGSGPYDRDTNFGWHGGPVGEDITHRGDPVMATDDWVNSVYHRFPMMRPDLSAIGFGDCAVGSLPMEDMEFGFGIVEQTRHDPTAYPGDGQTAVPASFFDNELPDPVPPGRPRTTGYPVTLTFDPAARATVSSYTISGPDGVALPAYLLAPDPRENNSATLLPIQPLAAHTRYTVHLRGTLDGAAYAHDWSFTTHA